MVGFLQRKSQASSFIAAENVAVLFYLFLKILRKRGVFFGSASDVFPVSKISVPFGSVTIYEVGKSFDVHCMSDGFTKNQVLPLPEPPITRMFLMRAYFGCFGRLFMVSRSVYVKGILFSNTGSVYGFMSSAVPHEAFVKPYCVTLHSVLWERSGARGQSHRKTYR